MLSFFFSLLLFARAETVPVLEGKWKVSSQYLVLSHLRWEKVSTITAEGQKRLEKLESDGYFCRSKDAANYDCTVFLKDLIPNLDVDSALGKTWVGRIFSFYHLVDEPELVTNTDFLKNYLVSQKVALQDPSQRTGPMIWNPVSYVWTPGPHWQIQLGNSLDPHSQSLHLEGKALSLTQTVDYERGSVLDRYRVQIHLEKMAP
ncbi:MAG: hypothetical protein ACAH59_04730 [Pseudobdellovibrionaceae bacterium]